jgi:predicted nucleic acid-binding protein
VRSSLLKRNARTRANSRANAGKARDYIGRALYQQADMTFSADAAPGELPLTSGAPGVVLDTNVALDWLVFAEPAVAALAAAVTSGQLRWFATPAMRVELAHVLGRGFATRHGCDPAATLAGWDAHALPQAHAPAARGLVCTDVDDQKFIDLAIEARAHWLVTRDRAVLRLARRARLQGLSILTPERWRLAQ